MTMLGWYLETTATAAVLALACAGLGRWTRLGAAARHALWVVVLVKMLTPTVVRWPAGWVPAAATPVAAAEVEAPRAPVELRPGPIVVEEVAVREVAPRVRPDSGSGTRTAAAPEVDWSGWLWTTLVAGWVAGTGVVLARQVVGIGRFAARVRRGAALPKWLESQLDEAAERIGVKAPRGRVVAGVETPLVWCLGRPVLVVPAEMMDALPRERWGCVLDHELAHLRRGDPLVGRLLMVGEWLWWWNPLFWWVRSRVEAEAELACDALVVSAAGRGRREYAEALIDVCALRRTVSPLGSIPALGLGRGGAGRFFERRLTMIVRGGGVREWSWGGRLAVGLMALLAVPGWSPAQEEGKSAEERPRAEARQRERREQRERIEVRRQRMRAEMERARAEMERAQAELQVRMAELQARMKAEMAEGEEGAGGADVSPEGGPEGAGMEGLGEELNELVAELGKLGPMIQEEVGEELKKLGPELQEQLKGLGPQVQEEVRRELEKAREEVRRARSQVRVEVRERLGEDVAPPEPPDAPEPPEMAEGPDGRPVPPRPPVAPRMMMRRVGPGMRGGPGGPGDVGPGMMGPGGPRQQELERRIDRLEEKFDSVLEEIRAMRREMGGRGEGRGADRP